VSELAWEVFGLWVGGGGQMSRLNSFVCWKNVSVVENSFIPGKKCVLSKV